MRCPKGYIQKPAKSGNCVKKTESVTQKKKRCPKGSRKNKSGECEKIDKQNFSKKKSHSKSPKSKMIAKFYNVANDIFPGHSEDGYILPKYNKEKNQKRKMVQKYIDKESKFNPGDILFVGSTSDSRYYEGAFVIISNDRKAIEYGDNAVSLPLYYRSQIPEKISYKALLENEFDNLGEATPDSEEYEFGMEFFAVAPGEDFKESWQDVINDYEAKGIY